VNTVHSLPAPLSRFRLPPQPGLLEQIIDKGMRARQRRSRLMSQQGASLSALKLIDTQVEQCVLALSLDRAEADRLLQARIEDAGVQGAAVLSAWVFLRCSLAVQCQATALPAWFDVCLAEHPEQARDALLFFPAQANLLEERNQHILPLLPLLRRQPSATVSVLLELVGRLSVHEARPDLLSIQRGARQMPSVHLALLRLGVFNTRSEAFVRHALAHGPVDQQVLALQLVAMSGWRRLYPLGRPLLRSPHAPLQSLAWALYALDQPKQATDSALALGVAPDAEGPQVTASGRLPEALWWRVLALGGHLKALMAACKHLASQQGPMTEPQTDFLWLVLGRVPPALCQKPNLPGPKQQALRELVLHCFRQAFVHLQNGADTAPWTLAAWAADPEQAADVRLRLARSLGHQRQAQGFPGVLPELSQPLRQWLYFERAHVTQCAYAMDAGEVARRQYDAAMLVDFVAELEATEAPNGPH